MTLKEYLYIPDDKFMLEIGDLWYCHRPEYNTLLDLQTKHRIDNINHLVREKSLSEQLKLNNPLHNEIGYQKFRLYHNGHLHYTERSRADYQNGLSQSKLLWSIYKINDSNQYHLYKEMHNQNIRRNQDTGEIEYLIKIRSKKNYV